MIKYLVLKKFLTINLFLNIYSPCHVKTGQEEKLVKFRSLSVSGRSLYKVRSHWLLRIVFFVMPGCHPGLLFHIFPVTIPGFYSSFLPFDANSVVTWNLVFIYSSLKKATSLFFMHLMSVSLFLLGPLYSFSQRLHTSTEGKPRGPTTASRAGRTAR